VSAAAALRPTRVMFIAPGLAGGVLAWEQAGEPARWAGLTVTALAGAAVWPLLLLGVVFGLPAAAGALLIPRRWRIWWRHQPGRDGLPRTRPAIRAFVRRAILAADRHACLYCGSPADPQLDHVRPWAAGGLNCLWNLAVLCGPCNRVKSNYWVWSSGHVSYRAFTGYANQAAAAAMLAAERRARLNPARWWRAAWSIGI
jgi:5-methylcytosine-specific restriction endonuclease McrA